MNRQNFNQSVGFPFQTETLHEMQKAYLLLQAFGDLAGNFSIISGCVTTGTNVTDGVVYINGELIEFKGGTASANVIIVQTVIKQEFEDATEKDVIYLRSATFGASVDSFPWSNFKRPKNTIQLTEDKAEKTAIQLLVDRIALLEARPAANVPVGMIAIWGGPENTIPVGWAEYVPLRGKTAVGLDPNDTDFDAVGTGSGAKNYTLETANLPSEQIRDVIAGSSFNAGIVKTSGGVIVSTAAATAFSIMNPYRIVHYIKYIG